MSQLCLNSRECPREENDTKSFELNGEPGRNRTFNPQIKSPIASSKTGGIRMILRARCAKRGNARHRAATPAQPPDRQANRRKRATREPLVCAGEHVGEAGPLKRLALMT